MSEAFPTTLVVAWLVMGTAILVARQRFQRSLVALTAEPVAEGGAAGLVRGVVTTVQARIPGLASLAVSDPVGTWLLLQRIGREALDLTETYEAELETLDPRGVRILLGRYRPDPEHRASGLSLALELAERLAPLAGEAGLEPPSLGVATDDSLSGPFPLPNGRLVPCFGKGPDRAGELCAAAGPGEVSVDEERAGVDQGFRFEVRAGRRILLGADPKPLVLAPGAGGSAPSEGPDPSGDREVEPSIPCSGSSSSA